MTDITTAATTADPVLKEIRRDIDERRIVIFLGAGISAALAEKHEEHGFNLASWGGLLMHGAQWAQDFCAYDEGFSKSVALDIKGDTNLMLAAAQKVSQALQDHNEYGKWLRASVGSLKYSSQAAKLAAHLKSRWHAMRRRGQHFSPCGREDWPCNMRLSPLADP
jgi:hypothetical protein